MVHAWWIFNMNGYYENLTGIEVKLLSDFIKNNCNNRDINFMIKSFYDDLYFNNNFIPLTPLFVTFCIANTCDLKCIHCSKFNNFDSDNAFISPDNFYIIIDLLKKWKVRSIFLSGGEPTLHPNFIEFVKYIKQNGFQLGILTNGQLSFYKKIVYLSKVLDENDYVQISVDNVESNYNKIRINGNFELLKQSIVKSLKYNINIKTNTVIQYLNINDLKSIYMYLTNLGVKDIRFVPMFYVENCNMHYLSELEVLKKFCDILLLDSGNYLINGMPISVFYPFVSWYNSNFEDNIEIGNFLCPALVSSAEINFKGDVYPCSYLDIDEYHYGNIFKDSIKKMWEKSQKRRLFLEMENESLFCKKCKIVSKCKGGCKASSIVTKGKIGFGDYFCIFNK